MHFLSAESWQDFTVKPFRLPRWPVCDDSAYNPTLENTWLTSHFELTVARKK
jgi:hypothetical protein